METAIKEQAVNTFILSVSLIDPIEKIIKGLENNDFRDCDMNWLNDKLKKASSVALEWMGKDIKVVEDVVGTGGSILNEYNRDRFLNYFRTILAFFKQYQ